MSESIYDDLRGTDLGENIQKLERTNQALQRHIEKLEGDILKLCTELTEMKRVQQNLTRNISELFKTAKAEITRKDKMIADLRSELDCLLFRRQSRVAPTEPLKRQNESYLSDSEPKRQKSEDSCTSRGTQVRPSSKSSEDSCRSKSTQARPSSKSSEDSYTHVKPSSKSEDVHRRRKSEHEDLKYSGKRYTRESDHSRRITSRSTHRDSKYTGSPPRGSQGRHYSSRCSRDRRSRSGHRRSTSRNKTKRTDASGKADTTTSADVEIKTKTIEAKMVTNGDSIGVSSSNNELQLKGDVTAQEDVIDSTVQSSHQSSSSSKTTESDFISASDPGEAVEHVVGALALVKEPVVLNVLSAAVKEVPAVLIGQGNAVLSINNSAVVEQSAVLKDSSLSASNSAVVKELTVLNGDYGAVLSDNSLMVIKEPESCDAVPPVNSSADVKESAVLNEGCASANTSAIAKELVVFNESCDSVNNSAVVKELAVLNESCDSANNSALVKEPAVLNDGCSSANNLTVVKEPVVLNESCSSANNTAVGRKPVRRRRCVVKIMD